MKKAIIRLAATLVGDSRGFTLEHRLFNTITLLNAAANIGGALTVQPGANYLYLLVIQLVTAIVFLVFYLLSRFRGLYRSMYLPFIVSMLVFLSADTLGNAGSLGGTHYYFIPALSIAIILSTRLRTTIMVIVLFCVATGAGFTVEWLRPGWIWGYESPLKRLIDISGNFLFVEVFSGVLILVLAKNLNLEREKSDRLLLNILPQKVASELKRDGAVKPLFYESASVLFTDMVGFTQIAEKLPPRVLIEELDRCFSVFDGIQTRNKLEKIKTIGDAYMAVGGVPTPNRTHAVDCVLAALEIQRHMQDMMETRVMGNEPHWQVRIGINTGPLVAGVIGREKFAYDVWGDTVNTASRLESSGSPGRVNISRATYEKVKDLFECEPRGKIAAKGKGELEMYFVNGIRPELTSDDGTSPNEAFETIRLAL